MKCTIAGVAAVAFALAAAPALALPAKSSQPFVGDGSNSAAPPGPFYSGTGSAYVGDGGNTAPAPGPYYNGTGTAEKSAAKYDQDSAQSREHSRSEGQY